MLILLGILDFSLAMKDSMSVSSATRAGIRFGAANARVGGSTGFYDGTAAAVAKVLLAISATGPQELWIYRASSTGYPIFSGAATTNFATGCDYCQKYTWDAATRSWTRPNAGTTEGGQSGTNAWTYISQYACQNTQTQSFGVYVKDNHDYVTGLIKPLAGSSVALTDRSVAKLEPQPSRAGAPCEPAAAAPATP